MRDGMGVGLAATQLGTPAPDARLPGRPRRAADRAGQPRDRVALGGPRHRRGGLPQPARDRRSTSSARCTSGSSGVDPTASELVIEASGLEARVLQHEIDHLDGVLILERAPARAAQGRDAGAARGRHLRARAPEAEELEGDPDSRPSARPRAPERLRTAYLGTSEFAATVLGALAASEHRPVAGRHAAGPAARAAARLAAPAAGRGAARELGLRAAPDRRRQRAGLGRGDRASPSAEAIVVCAFGQLISRPLLSDRGC